MNKPAPTLADLSPKRTASRTAPTEEPRRKRAAPEKTAMIGAHYANEAAFAFQELIGKMSRQKGRKVTVRAGMAEGLALLFEKYGETPPDGFTEAMRGE